MELPEDIQSLKEEKVKEVEEEEEEEEEEIRKEEEKTKKAERKASKKNSINTSMNMNNGMNNMNMNNGMNYYPPYYPPYYPQPYPYSTPYYPNHCCCHSHCCQQPQPMNSFNVFDFNSISPSSSLQSFLDMVEHACKASMQATSNEQQQEALSQLLLAFYQAGYSAGKYSNFM